MLLPSGVLLPVGAGVLLCWLLPPQAAMAATIRAASSSARIFFFIFILLLIDGSPFHLRKQLEEGSESALTYFTNAPC